MCPCVEVKAIPNFKSHIQILQTKVAYYAHHTDVIVLTLFPRITPCSDSRAVLGRSLTSGRPYVLL
jgi:hypothetical protein